MADKNGAFKIQTIEGMKAILRDLEFVDYNYVRIHLTTGESGSKQVQTFPWDSLGKL